MTTSTDLQRLPDIEWPTVALIVVSYSAWIVLAVHGTAVHPGLWVVLGAINVTLFMSLTHEVLHGHPTRSARLNSLLILFPIAWSIPYERFRDTHVAHHLVEELTDPFDDPESWYMAKGSWSSESRLMHLLLHFNNTLFGRMLIGPAIALTRFYVSEFLELVRNTGIRAYLLAVWAKHIMLWAVMGTVFHLASGIPAWQLLASVYLGHSILLVRTFLEHQAVPGQEERTVIIEKACPIAFLFLFNNYHFIHHDQPAVPWYRLPSLYRNGKEDFVRRNGAYMYRSYGEVFRRYFFHSKEPVTHPFLRVGK